jgi:hypothetical protein
MTRIPALLPSLNRTVLDVDLVLDPYCSDSLSLTDVRMLPERCGY